jgi:hypothetical protein
MSMGLSQKKHSFFAQLVWLGVPIIAGVLIDGASESLKFVAHGITNQLKLFLQEDVGFLNDLFVAPLAARVNEFETSAHGI